MQWNKRNIRNSESCQFYEFKTRGIVSLLYLLHRGKVERCDLNKSWLWLLFLVPCYRSLDNKLIKWANYLQLHMPGVDCLSYSSIGSLVCKTLIVQSKIMQNLCGIYSWSYSHAQTLCKHFLKSYYSLFQEPNTHLSNHFWKLLTPYV